MVYRSACSIEFEDKVVLTGGFDHTEITRVAVYDVDGFVEYLPNMNHKRSDHGCGHYIDSNDKMVQHKN